MRKIVVIEFLTLDGVIQSPGQKGEDECGGFDRGGWIAGYSDPALSSLIREAMALHFDLLLGRKYVATNALSSSSWENKSWQQTCKKTLIKSMNRGLLCQERVFWIFWTKVRMTGISVLSMIIASP